MKRIAQIFPGRRVHGRCVSVLATPLLVLVALLVSACGLGYPVKVRATMPSPATYGAVFSAAQQVIAGDGWTIVQANERSGLLSAQRRQTNSVDGITLVVGTDVQGVIMLWSFSTNEVMAVVPPQLTRMKLMRMTKTIADAAGVKHDDVLVDLGDGVKKPLTSVASF
jgi:hypothetical protein